MTAETDPSAKQTGLSELILTLREKNPYWYDDAKCAGKSPETFFSEKTNGDMIAKFVCGHCVVQNPCLSDSLKMGDEGYGVVGGLTKQQRKELLRDSDSLSVEESLDIITSHREKNYEASIKYLSHHGLSPLRQQKAARVDVVSQAPILVPSTEPTNGEHEFQAGYVGELYNGLFEQQ